jgi:hypothetical protein
MELMHRWVYLDFDPSPDRSDSQRLFLGMRFESFTFAESALISISVRSSVEIIEKSCF